MPKQTKIAKEIEGAIENTRSAYQQAGLAYDALSAPFQVAVTYPKIIAAAEKFAGALLGKEVLDVGCGAGTLLQMFNERGANCFGIDVAPVFVELARSRGLQVSEASMHDLPFGDETFDVVVSNYVLNYLPPEGQRLALQEKFRVLRPKGVMIFSYMHPSLMRSGRYQPTPPHYPSIVEDYFRPKRQEEIKFFDQKFILHLLDWPEIVNMVIESGFRLQELIDAEVPENLKEIVIGIKEELVAQFVQSFRYNPYAIFIVAIKEGL